MAYSHTIIMRHTLNVLCKSIRVFMTLVPQLDRHNWQESVLHN